MQEPLRALEEQSLRGKSVPGVLTLSLSYPYHETTALVRWKYELDARLLVALGCSLVAVFQAVWQLKGN